MSGANSLFRCLVLVLCAMLDPNYQYYIYEVSRALTKTANLLNPKEQLTRGFLKKLLRAVDRD